jgi:hypothetical protein
MVEVEYSMGKRPSIDNALLNKKDYKRFEVPTKIGGELTWFKAWLLFGLGFFFYCLIRLLL